MAALQDERSIDFSFDRDSSSASSEDETIGDLMMLANDDARKTFNTSDVIIQYTDDPNDSKTTSSTANQLTDFSYLLEKYEFKDLGNERFLRVLRAGDAADALPSLTDVVRVHYSMFIDMAEFPGPMDSTYFRSKSPVLLTLSDGVLPFIAVVILNMQVGSKVQAISLRREYGQLGIPPRIPATSKFLLEVELFSVSDVLTVDDYRSGLSKLELREMDFDSHIKLIKDMKNRAGKVYRDGSVSESLRVYRKCLKRLNDLRIPDEAGEITVTALTESVMSKIVFLAARLNRYPTVFKYAQMLISESTDDTRRGQAFYHRAKAHAAQGNFAEARRDLKRVSDLLPDNDDVAKLSASIQRQSATELARERARARAMLGLATDDRPGGL